MNGYAPNSVIGYIIASGIDPMPKDLLNECEGLLQQRPGHRQAGTRPLRGQGPLKRGRPTPQDLDDRLPPRASSGLSLHHRTRLGQARG